MRSFARNALCVCVCVCVCVWEGNRVTSQRSVQPIRNCLNRGLCTANTYEHHHCVYDVTLIKLTWKLKLTIMVRSVTFPTHACGVRPITMHVVSWPIRAGCACWKEELCRKLCVWEMRGIEKLKVHLWKCHNMCYNNKGTTIMYSIWKIMCFLTLKHVNIFCYTKYTK